MKQDEQTPVDATPDDAEARQLWVKLSRVPEFIRIQNAAISHEKIQQDNELTEAYKGLPISLFSTTEYKLISLQAQCWNLKEEKKRLVRQQLITNILYTCLIIALAACLWYRYRADTIQNIPKVTQPSFNASGAMVFMVFNFVSVNRLARCSSTASDKI